MDNNGATVPHKTNAMTSPRFRHSPVSVSASEEHLHCYLSANWARVAAIGRSRLPEEGSHMHQGKERSAVWASVAQEYEIPRGGLDCVEIDKVIEGHSQKRS